MMTLDGGGGPTPPNIKKIITNNTPPNVKKSITNNIKEMKALITVDNDRVIFNMKKALSLDANISYKDTEDGKTVISINKNGNITEEIFDNVPIEVKQGIDKANMIKNKKISKNTAKDAVNIKYKIGDIVVLKGKIKDGSKRLIKKFEVKKVIWSIKSKPMNILILKQLEGVNNNRTLDKNDCKKYHIKYEEGLQAYSMMLNFVRLKKR